MELDGLGRTSKWQAYLVDRPFDEMLTGVDAEDDAKARKSMFKLRRKEYQTVQNDLIHRLDEALPQDFDRTVPGKLPRLKRGIARAAERLATAQSWQTHRTWADPCFCSDCAQPCRVAASKCTRWSWGAIPR